MLVGIGTKLVVERDEQTRNAGPRAAALQCAARRLIEASLSNIKRDVPLRRYHKRLRPAGLGVPIVGRRASIVVEQRNILGSKRPLDCRIAIDPRLRRHRRSPA
jgi:hypothetical protein